MTRLLKVITRTMQDLKATDMQTYHVEPITSITDYMVVASGRSARQVQAIAERITETTKQHGYRPLGIEGQQQGEWILLDFGDVIAHIMQPATRRYYQLEKLWAVDNQVKRQS